MGASGQQQGRSQPAPSGGRPEPTPSQGGWPATSSQSGMAAAPKQSGKASTPRQCGEPASTGKSNPSGASGGPSNCPLGQGGAGDGAGTDWYQMYMCKTQGGISEPPGPPYPVGMAEERREAVGHIYDRVAGKEPPKHNITSRALRAYYTRDDPQTLSTWACQILCIIAERLPPLADYAPPEDQTGATDIRIRDHWARTLRVAVLCHRLDMTLRQEPGSSRTLVRSRHCCGDLLAYFLSPGTAWELHFEDVVTQVLKENRRHLETKRAKAVTSLTNCN